MAKWKKKHKPRTPSLPKQPKPSEEPMYTSKQVDVMVQRGMWMVAKAFTRAFGIGTKRFCRDFLPSYVEVIRIFNSQADIDIRCADANLEDFARLLTGEEITIGTGDIQMELPLTEAVKTKPHE